MRRLGWIVLLLILIGVLAACGGSSDDDELPTVFVMPTDPPTSEVPTETPTEEASVTPEPTLESTEPVSGLPFLTPQAEQTEETSGLPFSLPQNTEGGASGLPFPLPQLTQQPGGSGLPFLNSPNETGIINNEEPVNVYECAETTCDVLTTLEKGDAVAVLSTEEDWLNVRYEEFTGFVEAQYIIPLSEALASGDPELIREVSRSSSQLPPGVTEDMLATQTAQPPVNRASLVPLGGTITPPPQSLPPGVNARTAQPGPSIEDLLKTGTPTGN